MAAKKKDGGKYLDFLKVQKMDYEHPIDPDYIDGRNVAFRCRRLTVDEWLQCIDAAQSSDALGVNVQRSGMAVLMLALEAVVERTINEETGEETVTETPVKPMVRDENGNVIEGDFDFDLLPTEIRVELAVAAANQLWSEEDNAGEG